MLMSVMMLLRSTWLSDQADRGNICNASMMMTYRVQMQRSGLSSRENHTDQRLRRGLYEGVDSKNEEFKPYGCA